MHLSQDKTASNPLYICSFIDWLTNQRSPFELARSGLLGRCLQIYSRNLEIFSKQKRSLSGFFSRIYNGQNTNIPQFHSAAEKSNTKYNDARKICRKKEERSAIMTPLSSTKKKNKEKVSKMNYGLLDDLRRNQKFGKFLLTPMGDLAPGSAHVGPFAQPPIDMSGYCLQNRLQTSPQTSGVRGGPLWFWCVNISFFD